jgi:hypothetical protein
MNPELTWRVGVNWLEAQMREGGWLPTPGFAKSLMASDGASFVP